MSEFKPVSTIEDAQSLDGDEVIEGYRAGSRGDPEPGNNHTRSYWHGWRNGMADTNRMPTDEHMHMLARKYVESGLFEAMFQVRN